MSDRSLLSNVQCNKRATKFSSWPKLTIICDNEKLAKLPSQWFGVWMLQKLKKMVLTGRLYFGIKQHNESTQIIKAHIKDPAYIQNVRTIRHTQTYTHTQTIKNTQYHHLIPNKKTSGTLTRRSRKDFWVVYNDEFVRFSSSDWSSESAVG